MQASPGGLVEKFLNLLAAGDECIQLPLLLRLLVHAQIEDGIAQTRDALQLHARPKGNVAHLHRRRFRKIRDLTRIARGIHICDVIAGD